MPIYEVNGRRANVKDASVNKFLGQYPDAKLIDNEPYSIVRTGSTRREYDISAQSDNRSQENQAETQLNKDLPQNGYNLNIPDYAGSIGKNVSKMSVGNNKDTSLNTQVAKSMQDMPVSEEAYFDSSVDRYQQEKEWIEQIKNDNTISEKVKQSLLDDYQNNIRISDLSVEEKDLPPAAKEWLERNKVSRQVTQYNPSIMGGGSYTTTVKENTPEQIAFIKDYVANSTEGKGYAQAHKQWIEDLEKEIDPLITQGQQLREKASKEANRYNREIGVETSFGNFLGDKDVSLTSKAINVLKEAKKRLEANRNGGGFRKGFHITNEDAAAFATFSEFTNDAYLNQVIDKYEKNPESLSDEEKLAIQAKYVADQFTAGVDPGSWYNIGATTRKSLPFMRDFIISAPIGGGAAGLVKGGASTLAAKTGANLLLSRGIGSTISKLGKAAIDLSVRPYIQSRFSPSSYAMALEEMQGQASDRDKQGNIKFKNRKTFKHGMTSAFFENQSEVLGEVVLDKLFQKLRIPIPSFLRNKAIQRLHNATGIQGPVTEYLEEKYSDLVNIVRGEQTIEGFLDPRSNLETFGAVAIMQIPFSAIQGTGYGIGKIKDIQAKRAIRQSYDRSSSNLHKYLNEDTQVAIDNFNNLVDTSSEEELKEVLTSVIEDKQLENNAKRAIVEYVTSYSAYSGLNKAKQEEIQQIEEETVQLIQENVNPEMNAIVSASIAGYDSPMQVASGDIVSNKDGSINRESSDQSVTIIDSEGKRIPISINFVKPIVENIPTEEAIKQATQIVSEPILAQQQNEEVREYTPGEIVRTIDGVIGRIAENEDGSVMVDANGNYILMVDTPTGSQQLATEPRNIVNEDNLLGVENGSNVTYTNDEGLKVQGIVSTSPDLYAQGLIAFENGDVIPISNVEGLVQEEEQLPSSDVVMEENGLDKPSMNQAIPIPEEKTPFIEQIPQDEKGNLLFDQVPVETTIGALNEVYNDAAELLDVVDATINNVRKQIEKAKSPKPTGDITKDIANKRTANQQIEELTNRLSYWEGVRNTIQQSKPIEQRVNEQLTGQANKSDEISNDVQTEVLANKEEPSLADVPSDLSKEDQVDPISTPIEQQTDMFDNSDTDEIVTNTEPILESTLKAFNDINVVDYSEKSIAVYGNTKEIKDQLKTLGGRFNPKLKDGAGWIFPKSKESNVRALIEEQSTTAELSDTELSTAAYGASNTLVSTERYEELRKQMRDKLNNLNSGFDPELYTIGTQMAMYHIEAGSRKFADFANKMIVDLGDKVKPYLKSFYEGARQMPGMEVMRNEMDRFNTVNSFDVDNLSTFEESNTPNINSNETNSDKPSDNRIAENGGISTRVTDADVRERTAATQTDGRTQSQQRPTMETESLGQRGRSDPDGGNNAESSGAELRASATERNFDNRRKDTADTAHAGKPLNTNNNKQSRQENIIPRGNTAKINANIAAIKLAKRLTETGKKATPEQMNVLRKYTGWGGLSSVFQQNDKNYKALQDLLTEEEYDSARASTTTAFYTPSEVTASVWDMIEKLGFKGGTILEPSAGIGNFFALMPENISNISRLRGVELDTISGNILKLLYPDANINVSGFEKQRIANNSMDLVVSNVPFGNFKVYDTNNKDISNQFDIHDYFIAKSIRTLKSGGIGVFITTSSTLDKSSALRNWVINNGNADFIDAVRLNTDTFKNDAGTEATADIIIVRKRDVNGISAYAKNMQDSVIEREATYTQQEKDKWGYNTGEVEKKARMVYNKYFLDNPSRMAGEMKFGFEGGNAIRPTEQRLAPVKAINQQEVINQMIDELPSDIYNTTPADKTSKAVANNGTKEGGLTIIDGQAYSVQYNEAVPVDWNSNKAAGYPKEEVLQDYLDIKNTISELLEAESSTDNELVYINKTRTKLNKAYDNFVKKYGNLNENRKINFLQDDIDFPSVAAIENIEDGKDGVKTMSKSDIFYKRVINKQMEPKADNVEDAVRVSINQNGKVDIPYIAQLLDKTNQEVQSEIVSKRIGFVNPETGLVEARNQYLSGNVRDKLSIAQQANQANEYDRNIEELSKVIPADIPINLIKLTLGSTWVPTNVYEDFFKETFDVGAQFTKTSTDKYIGKFSGKDNAKDIQMGMPQASGSTLALNSMNNATTTISMEVWEDGKRKTVTDPLKTAQAAAKQSEIAEAFEAWVKQNKKYHEELENIYNNTFNAVVNSTVDVDSFDRFPGVGGKVVALGSNKLENGKELHQYRVAKENTEADNELVAKEAKSLGLDYNAETAVYATTNRGNADTFAKKLNGTAKILRQHQKEGVIRGLESATLLAHEVGTGKTLTLITTAMEMRRLGLAKKPTIVVQRSTYKQFVKEIKNQYPNAKVLAPSAKDLTAKQREQLFAKIAYNDWDIVVLYHSYLDSIPDNPQRVAQYIDEKIQEKMDLLAEMERAKEDGAANAGRMLATLKKEIERLERDRNNTLNPDIEEASDTPTKSKRKRSVKDIEKVRSNAEAKAEKSLDRRTDNTMTFEQLGIDALLIDEAHAYKKLGFVTSLQRVKGIDTAESKRAQSTRLKTSYILENHNGKNIVLATGTPISNTMAEMWTFMRYLYPRTEMGRLQMNNFDAFVNNFGSIEESAEFGSNGKFRITNRFSSYSNVPELIAAWRQVAHTVLTEEVSTLKEGVGTPRVEGGKPADIMLEQTPPLKSVMKAIKNKLEDFDRMSGAQKKENSYIPLVMFGLAKRAAIDVRLVDPNLPDHPESKLNRTVAEVVQDLKETQNYKGTIAIFCDSYQSSDKTFNVFRELKQKLVDSGIPAEQVAIINDFDKDEAKERLFTSVNNGDVRVVLGTTEKLGVGVNIQERLHMAVHMDAPLRPSDYQQRNGRIMRQGNTHLNMDKTIKILRIGVQKTLDVTGYQRLEIKKKFIDQIMKGDVSQRMLEEADIESTDSSNFNQMMANLSGSQAALALSIEQNKLKKLQNAKQYHEDNQVYMAGAVRRAKGVIVGNGQAIERFEDYKKELNKLFAEGKVTTVSIGKVSANTPEDIDALLSKHITKRIDKEAADLREDFDRNSAKLKTSMLVDGIKIDLEIEINRNYDAQTNKTRVTREIYYTTPNNSIENPHSTKNEVIPLFESKAGANVQNVIDQINDLLSGYDIEREIQRYKIGIDKAQRDIDAYEPQIGQPFAKDSELKATEEKVEDLNAQMEVELKQIEEAESKEDVEAIDIDGIVEKNTDDTPEDDPTPPSGGRRQTSSFVNFQSIPAEKFDRLIDKLTQTGLAVDVVLNEDIRNNPELQDAEGNVYGYVTPESVVHLDATRMNANTPIHEFAHLWNSFTKENDTALYNRGVELIKQSPYWERVNNNTDYASLSEGQKADEALAMAIGDKGEAITNRNLKQQFVDWLSDVWQSIKRAFGINTNVSLADMTLSDFTDRAVQDLLGGERLTDTSVQSEEKRMQSVNDLSETNNQPNIEKASQELDRKLKGLFFKFREGWEDSMLAVKRFQEVLEKHGTKIEEYNNFYLKATHIRSINQAQEELYKKTIQKPLDVAISKSIEKGFTLRNIENYAILKHGLERNEWMRQDAIDQYKANNPEATQEQIDNYAESLPDDYAGITAVQEEVGMSAEEFITEFENKAGKKLIDSFWKRVRDATQFSLNKYFEGLSITKKQYEDLSNRFKYYIPLRGHDNMVAEDKYDYTPSMGTYFSNPLIQANGRRSRSEKPFAFITQMAMSAISASNQNIEKQKILRLALKDKTGLMRVSKAWYEYKGLLEGEDVWEKVQPRYSSNAEVFQKNINDFELRMQELADQGKAIQKQDKLKLGMFIKPAQAKQHEVHVTQNGVDYVVYINANPAVARAINGENLVHVGKVAESITDVSRFMAANFTTRNPLFIAKNFQRDYTYASSILTVKEDAKYAIQFQKNLGQSAMALQRYLRGSSDLTKEQDKFFIEFIMNGGKTGFSHMLELQELQQAFEKGLKKIDRKNYLQNILDVINAGNEFAENLARLSVYITSRKDGRSVVKSISDAKNVTVNFNKSGSGQMGAAYIRPLYLFVNAAIQSLSNKAHIAKDNPKKAAALFSFYAIAPTVLNLAIALLVGGDDGFEKYLNLNEWERQNHLCIYTGIGFIKWSLPHELRVWNRIGDDFVQAYLGKKEYADAIKNIPSSFSDLLPIDPTAASDASWAEYMPDFTRPFFQLVANKNFMGGRIYNKWIDPNTPGYLQARTNKKGKTMAPDLLVDVTKRLDNLTGGNGVKQGVISLNPDLVEHFARGYFGGLYTFLMRSANTVAGLIGDDKLAIRDTPLKDLFISNEDIQVVVSYIDKKVDGIRTELKETERQLKGYQEQLQKGDISMDVFASKIKNMEAEIEKYNELLPYMKQIKKYESILKDLDGEDQKQAEIIISDLKKEVLEINSIGK